MIIAVRGVDLKTYQIKWEPYFAVTDLGDWFEITDVENDVGHIVAKDSGLWCGWRWKKEYDWSPLLEAVRNHVISEAVLKKLPKSE